MAAALKILLLVTSQATMGDSPRPTGVWLEELTTPYYAFVDAGAEVDIASIKGGPVPLDPHSLAAAGGNPPSVERFLHDRSAMARLQTTAAVSQLDGHGYAAVFLPGGHGTMWTSRQYRAGQPAWQHVARWQGGGCGMPRPGRPA
jgi:putative intracellular protease/amidase